MKLIPKKLKGNPEKEKEGYFHLVLLGLKLLGQLFLFFFLSWFTKKQNPISNIIQNIYINLEEIERERKIWRCDYFWDRRHTDFFYAWGCSSSTFFVTLCMRSQALSDQMLKTLTLGNFNRSSIFYKLRFRVSNN